MLIIVYNYIENIETSTLYSAGPSVQFTWLRLLARNRHKMTTAALLSTKTFSKAVEKCMVVEKKDKCILVHQFCLMVYNYYNQDLK